MLIILSCDDTSDPVVDCNGISNGSAYINDCGCCVGGSTGLTSASMLDCAGECGGASVLVPLCEDTDGDGLGNPGTETEECVEGGRDITDGCDLPENNFYLNEGEVLYNSSYDIGGFQFSVEGTTLNGAEGGDAADARPAALRP